MVDRELLGACSKSEIRVNPLVTIFDMKKRQSSGFGHKMQAREISLLPKDFTASMN